VWRMADPTDDRVERYFAGQLSAAEERELAQAALDDPDLFDELTALAVTKDAIVQPAAVLPFRRRRVAVALGAIATLAASLLVFVVFQRSSSPVEPPESLAVSSSPPDATPAPPPKALTLGSAPVILTARLAEASSPEFRAGGGDTRAPKAQGAVVEVNDGVAAVDLGSLDGVAQGTVLVVSRGQTKGPAIARLTITRVFRERSTGLADGSDTVRVGDRAEVPVAAESAAYLERVSARLAAGDLNAARTAAERAVALAQSAEVPADQRQRAQASLAEVLNELGAASIARAEYEEAERLLQQAREAATGAVSAYVINNLAAVAALRGDLRTAEALYREALALAGTSADRESDRRAIEKNLEALRAAR
jgi:hypothetical protein